MVHNNEPPPFARAVFPALVEVAGTPHYGENPRQAPYFAVYYGCAAGIEIIVGSGEKKKGRDHQEDVARPEVYAFYIGSVCDVFYLAQQDGVAFVHIKKGISETRQHSFVFTFRAAELEGDFITRVVSDALFGGLFQQ